MNASICTLHMFTHKSSHSFTFLSVILLALFPFISPPNYTIKQNFPNDDFCYIHYIYSYIESKCSSFFLQFISFHQKISSFFLGQSFQKKMRHFNFILFCLVSCFKKILCWYMYCGYLLLLSVPFIFFFVF